MRSGGVIQYLSSAYQTQNPITTIPEPTRIFRDVLLLQISFAKAHEGSFSLKKVSTKKLPNKQPKTTVKQATANTEILSSALNDDEKWLQRKAVATKSGCNEKWLRRKALQNGGAGESGYKAAAPLTISIISLVIAACRTRFICSESASIISPALVVAESIAVIRAACSAATLSRNAWKSCVVM